MMTSLFRLLCILLLLCSTPAFAQELRDSDGRTIHFDRPFCRIISLYPAHTENLIQLGLRWLDRKSVV